MKPVIYTRGQALPGLLEQRILVLDGAMGTALQKYCLDENDYRGERFKSHPSELKGNNDLLALTRPHIVREVHGSYLAAGSDIISTNTFSGTSVSQADYGLESIVYDLNVEATRLAKSIALEYSERTPEKPRFVAGAMGPTTKMLSPQALAPTGSARGGVQIFGARPRAGSRRSGRSRPKPRDDWHSETCAKAPANWRL